MRNFKRVVLVEYVERGYEINLFVFIYFWFLLGLEWLRVNIVVY